MLGKTEIKVGRSRGDGRHCDLCGCSFPAVRCDKCGSQIFCLSCDDMYHRHPKRRFHLRKAVDPTPTPQARPVLPMKVSQLASTPGDPSKMPLPPPRKKKPGKSFFDTFRRGSPSSDNSPPLPKKEYSWTDRLGSIKKFMSNRPLPPLPKDEDKQEQKSSPPFPRKNDMSFIHKRVDEKPPQLPHRTQAKSPSRKLSGNDLLNFNQQGYMPDKPEDWPSSFGAPMDNFRQTPVAPPTQHLNGQVSRDSSERELSAGRFRSKSIQEDVPTSGIPNFLELQNVSPTTMPPDVRGYSTLKRPSPHRQDIHNQSFMSMAGDHFHGMHTSSSVTDLHALDSPPVRGPQQFSNYPMPPHYPHPYPMYPHYPNYPQYFGTSFANLSTALPNTDGDFSDQSDISNFSSKKHLKHSAFGMKAKRSQSVMYDRMAYPPQYYPFGGFPPHPPLPGYGAAPWGQSDHPVEAPPSPATSVRSFGRSHRSRHRKKKMVASDNDDEDERLSVRSSPRSRTTSSSDRLRKRKTPKKFERSVSPSSLTSSEEEENQAKEERLSPEMHVELSQGDGYQTKQDKKKVSKQVKDATKSVHKTKQYGSKMRASSHQKLKTDDKNFSPKVKKKEKAPLSSSESMDVNEGEAEPSMKTEEYVQDQQDAEMKEESDYHSEGDVKEENEMDEPKTEYAVSEQYALSEGQWQCEHCTFINSSEHRICQVCYKSKPGSVPQTDSTSLAVPEIQGSSSAAASPDIPALNTTSESLTSDTAKEYLTPPAAADDDSHSAHSENEGQNFAKLNSDLEQAEKELSRGLMELMKLKEESEIASAQTASRKLSDDIPATKEAIATESSQIEVKPVVPEIEATLPIFTDKIEPSSEQMYIQPSVTKVENVSSKSIGTDSMDFDFPTHQAPVSENTTAPLAKNTNFGLNIQGGQLSPESSFSEIMSSGSSSQKDTGIKPAALRRDSSCQTYQDTVQQVENEIPPFPHADNMDFQYPYNRADTMKSPQLPPMGPSGYRGFSSRGQGMMHRSHSRSSLFGDRYSDARVVPPEFENLGFGFGPSPMYRSLSRSSLTGDYSDPWMPEARSLRRPDFYLSMEELVERRRLETKRAQGLELVRMIREAEQQGFTADDIHVALNNCGKQNPVDWLQTNWRGMVDTVVTLATNYGKDKHENDIGVLSENEARDALRIHKGNIWAAVTECVEGRQRKFLELKARGNFSTKEIIDALTQSEGNVELAYTRLSATTLKPFLMRIWGAGEGVENQDGAVYDPAEFFDPGSSGWPRNSTLRTGNVPFGETERCSDQEDWDDDDDVEDEVSWNEDEEEEMENPESFEIEPRIIHPEKRGLASNHIATPESDSEYCDAFDPVGDARSATSSSPADEIFFVSPESGMESQKDKKKGTSFLSRLAALRKNKKPQAVDIAEKDGDHIKKSVSQEADSVDSQHLMAKNGQAEAKVGPNDSNASNSETNRIYGPLNILKQTFSAIKDSVIGSNSKNETKHSRSITEARTIIVHDRAGKEASVSEENLEKTEKAKLSNDLLIHTHQETEDISIIADESHSKEKQSLRVHTSQTSNDNSANEVLPVASITNCDVHMANASTSVEKTPPKQDNKGNSKLHVENSKSDIENPKFDVENLKSDVENSDSEVRNSTDAVISLDNKQNKRDSVSARNQFEEDSRQILTMTLPVKSVEDDNTIKAKPLNPETLKEQTQGKNYISADVKTDDKDNSFIIQQASPEKLEKAQKSSSAVPDKISDNVSRTDADLQQINLPKSTEETPLNELSAEITMKNDSKRDTLFQNAARDDKIKKDPPIASVINGTEKTPETVLTKSKDAKSKPKRQKEGLRLKMPDLEKTNSELPKDQHTPQTQKGEILSKESISSNTATGLDKKQDALKKESKEIVASAAESHLVPEEESNTSSKSQENKKSNISKILPVKPIESSSSTTKTSQQNEERSVVGGKANTNITENEFHDMASKITEKIENCIEELQSSETAIGESKESVLPSPEIEQLVTPANETFQSKTNSFQHSETIKENDDKSVADVPTVPIDREKGKKDDDSAYDSSQSSNQNQIADKLIKSDAIVKEPSASPAKCSSSDAIEEQRTSDDKTLEKLQRKTSASAPTEIVKEASASPAKCSSSDAIEEQRTSDGKTLEQLQLKTNASAAPESTKDSSVTNDSSDKSSTINNNTSSIIKTESLVSSSPIVTKSNDSIVGPLIFPGVKAKTFTGFANQKAKYQSPGSYKKQKDIFTVSPTPKASGIIQADKLPASKKDSLEEKQMPTKTTDSKIVDVAQPQQNEIEQNVRPINISKDEKTSSVLDDQNFQTTPDGNKNETPVFVHTEHEKPGFIEPSSSEVHQTSTKSAAQPTPETPATSDVIAAEESRESKSERADSNIQVKEQDMKVNSDAASSETAVSESSKASSSLEKQQQGENNASSAVTNEPSHSLSSQDEKLNAEVEEITGSLPAQKDITPSPPVVFGDKRPASRVEALRHSFHEGGESSQARSQSPLRPQSPFGRMTSLSARKEAIAQERNKEISSTPTTEKKPWFIEKVQPPKPTYPKRSIKQQLEFERKIRKLVSERKCRTYRKAEIVVQLLEMNFVEEEALHAAHECSTLEQAISYLQQECLLCTGMYPVGQIVSMIHCPHKACRECIKAYFTIQIRDRTIMELQCPFCNEPDISDEEVAQDYFNHLDILLKKLVETEIHELFQRKLRDRVLMKDPNFRWCSKCSSGFISMPNLKRLICPDCNAITCASCRRPWEREHEGVSCEAFATWKDANDPEAQTAGLAKLLQEDGIDCPNCHFRYTLAKGGCMHFRCIQCQHDFCSGCSRPFKMGQKCGVSEYCAKLGLHAHHPRNCLFYLRDKDPEDLQRLLELNDIDYDKDPPEGMEFKYVCQVMEQKETPEGLVDDICRKEVLESQAGLCRVHYVEYLGQLVNKYRIDPIQIFCNDDLELVLRRASKRLPARNYRDTDVKYREKLVQLIQEELPLELTEGS